MTKRVKAYIHFIRHTWFDHTSSVKLKIGFARVGEDDHAWPQLPKLTISAWAKGDAASIEDYPNLEWTMWGQLGLSEAERMVRTLRHLERRADMRGRRGARTVAEQLYTMFTAADVTEYSVMTRAPDGVSAGDFATYEVEDCLGFCETLSAAVRDAHTNGGVTVWDH